MGHSYRPRGIVVEKMRSDGGNGYEALEYVVESPDADCGELFGVEKADAYGDEATTVLCRSYASELPHLGGENVNTQHYNTSFSRSFSQVNVSLFGYEGNLRPQGDSVAFVVSAPLRRIQSECVFYIGFRHRASNSNSLQRLHRRGPTSSGAYSEPG